MALLGAAVLLGAIFTGVSNLRAASDQRDYHLRVIEQFSSQLPRPDLSDYRSATGPGYHLLMAVVHRWFTNDERALRAVSAGITLLLLAMLGWAVGRYVKWTTAVALCLPMLTSLYVFVSGVWLLPDNLAWLTVLAALLVAHRPRADDLMFVAAALVLAAAVFVRQTNLWPLGVLVLAATLSPFEPVEGELALRPPLHPLWRRVSVLMLLMGIPAVVVLAWFYRMWHGLTPPAFQSTHGGPLPPGHSGWQHEGPNFAVPAMVLAVLGTTGLFYAGFFWRGVRHGLSVHNRGKVLILMGVLVGAAAALLVPTDMSHAGGRWSGLWNVSTKFPVVAHRSLLIAPLAAIGGATVVLWFLALGPRDRWIWLATWLCFTVAQTANAMAWQKYYEPFCLMMLALAAGRVARRHGAPRLAAAGPLALATLLAGVTLWSLTRG
jgi:hypothetical protein